MVKNDGKLSERYFLDNIEGIVFRLRDKKDLMGLNRGKNIASFGNPSDYILVRKDGIFLAEVKSTVSETSFSLSGFTSSQKVAMAKMNKAGCGHLYQIYIHSLHLNRWHLITATDFCSMIKTGKKSIPWATLQKYSLML